MSDTENQPSGAPKKPGKIITKTISFGGKKVTLYSLDGNTWSSRKDELAIIQERQETGRITLAGDKGKEQSRFNRPPVKFQKKNADDEETDEELENDEDLALDDEYDDIIDEEDNIDAKKGKKIKEDTKALKGSVQAKSKKPEAKKPAPKKPTKAEKPKPKKEAKKPDKKSTAKKKTATKPKPAKKKGKK